MKDLRTCPFCGGEEAICEPFAKIFWFVSCSNGDMCGTCGHDRETRSAAIEALNTRAERTCRMESNFDNVVCSDCGEVMFSTAIRNYCPNCGAKVVE